MKKSLFYIVLLCMQLLAAGNAELFWNTYTAALRGEKEAQFQTGVMFERGIGTDVNQSQAAKWYEKAAIQGHIDAQYNMGLMYASGRGIEVCDDVAGLVCKAGGQRIQNPAFEADRRKDKIKL
jgi:TPR repeat protein